MPYTLEQTDQMESALRALPPMDSSKRRLTKQAVVKRLAREIAALQGRGYSMEQVGESLRGIGLEITTPTLKSYLQRVKKRTSKAGTKRQGRLAPTATTQAREQQTPPAAEEPKADATAKRGGKDAFLVKDKDSY